MGKSSGTTIQTAEPTPEQRAMIGAQTDFFTSTIVPAYQQAVGGARDIYNQSAQGYNYAAQNLAGVAGQAQETLGGTGEAALRTGISGLQSLFDPNYEAQQIRAAIMPAQQQYVTNLANQRASFGGAGSMGSARQALADTALAGQTQALQQQAAANVANNVAQQRAQAATQLAGLGQGGLGQAIGAAQTGVSAAGQPLDLYNRYASVIFGTPAQSWNPDFSGTQGRTTNSNQWQWSANPGNWFK